MYQMRDETAIIDIGRDTAILSIVKHNSDADEIVAESQHTS
jgi:hypothetical protein